MLKKIAAAAALAIVASTAAAQDAPAFYIGADAGQTKIDDFGDRETSYGVFAGYQINPSFAIEANYRNLAEFDYRVGTVTADLETTQIGLSVIGAMPLSSNFSLYGRLGYNRVDVKATVGTASADEDESGVLYGVGLNYDFSPTVSARVEFQKPTSDSTNVSAGVSFKF